MGSQNGSFKEEDIESVSENGEEQSFYSLSPEKKAELEDFFKKPDSSYHKDNEINNLDDDINEEYGYGANGEHLEGPLDIHDTGVLTSEEDNSGFFLDEIKRIKNKTEQKFLMWVVNTRKKELIGKKELRFFSDFRTQAFQKYLSDFVEAHIHEDGDGDEKMDIQVLQSLLEKNPEFLKPYKRLDHILLSAVFQLKKMEIHLNLWSQKKLDNNTNDTVTIVASYLKNFPRLNDPAMAAVIANFIQDNPKIDLSNYKNFTHLSIVAAKSEFHKALKLTANPEDRENAVACFLAVNGLNNNIANIKEHPLYYHTLNRMTENTIDGIKAIIQKYKNNTTFQKEINERKSLEELVYLLGKKRPTLRKLSFQSDPVEDFLKKCKELTGDKYFLNQQYEKVKKYLATCSLEQIQGLLDYKSLAAFIKNIDTELLKQKSLTPSPGQLKKIAPLEGPAIGKSKSSNVFRKEKTLRSSRKTRSRGFSNP